MGDFDINEISSLVEKGEDILSKDRPEKNGSYFKDEIVPALKKINELKSYVESNQENISKKYTDYIDAFNKLEEKLRNKNSPSSDVASWEIRNNANISINDYKKAIKEVKEHIKNTLDDIDKVLNGYSKCNHSGLGKGLLLEKQKLVESALEYTNGFREQYVKYDCVLREAK